MTRRLLLNWIARRRKLVSSRRNLAKDWKCVQEKKFVLKDLNANFKYFKWWLIWKMRRLIVVFDSSEDSCLHVLVRTSSAMLNSNICSVSWCCRPWRQKSQYSCGSLRHKWSEKWVWLQWELGDWQRSQIISDFKLSSAYM